MAQTAAWVLAVVLAVLLPLLAGFCLMDRNLWRACLGFVVFALLMSLAWLLLGAPWLAVAEALFGALLTGGTLLWTLRGRGPLPRLSALDETPRRALLMAPLRWLLILIWLGLVGAALVWLLGIEALTLPTSISALLTTTGVPILALGLWAFTTQRHLLRRLLAFNLLGSGVFLLLAGLVAPAPVPTAEVRALIFIGLVVALLGSVLGAALLLRLHAQGGQITLNAVYGAGAGAGAGANAGMGTSAGLALGTESDAAGDAGTGFGPSPGR
ncbi:MAG: hydrogenase subunit MbhD domain-containing protein [Lamprobacter sp.]|uniref:hydrogenase subunit MbhD domain-containing protein n=1 Tax=Lamprobacter sp. TaxID=3100796 RepID=UPI002B25A09F|nr:hydrogenase subunit MbhD domain-containing protein [Lamprobacter sp.]MEA3640481.1 hydrogenase subunit MbhD domain-containing protein [Lamprobacter sp.]